MGEHLLLIFHDITSDWNGQIGEVSLSGRKLHRITNDLSSYSNLTLARDQETESNSSQFKTRLTAACTP